MPERPASEIIVHDQSRKVPQPRGKDQKIDRELQAELRIAQALAAGADGTLENISQDHFEAEFKAMALNSKIAAAADLDCYVDWCLAEQRAAFPADPVTLVRYIEAKVKAKAKPATIVRRISSIAKAHHMLGLEPEGPRNRMVRQTLVAINKKKNQRQAAAIHRHQLAHHHPSITGVLRQHASGPSRCSPSLSRLLRRPARERADRGHRRGP